METVAEPVPRPLPELCEAARRANCGQCWALPCEECVYTTAPVSVPVTPGTPVRPVRGYHVAWSGRAMRCGLISGPELVAVLAVPGGFTNATVIYEDGAS